MLLLGVAPVVGQDRSGGEPAPLPPAAGAPSTYPAQVLIQIPFGGRVQAGWNPVAVEIKYSGKETVEAKCRLRLENSRNEDIQQEVWAPVSLSPGSTKRVWLYLFVGADYYYQSRCIVELTAAEGRPLSAAQEQGFDTATNGYRIGVFARDAMSNPIPNFNYNQSQNWGNTQVVSLPLSPALAPDRWIGYDKIDLVVLNDCALDDFTPASEQALLDWVARGGTILLSPGSNPGWEKARFARLLWPAPVTREEADVEQLSSLKALSKDGSNPGDLSDGRMMFSHTSAETLLTLADGKTPLLSERRLGFGSVLFIGVDISRPPITLWNQRVVLWSHLMGRAMTQPGRSQTFAAQAPYPHRDSMRNYSRGGSVQTFFGALSAEITRLPPVLLVLLVMALYVVLVGPINFFWLRKRGRHQWLGVTIPALAALFVTINLLMGYATRGMQTMGQRLVVTEIPAAPGPAVESQFYCLCSSSSSRYRIAADVAAVPWALASGQVEPLEKASRSQWEQGKTFALEDAALQTWDFGYFRSDAVRPEFGRVRLLPAGTGFVVKNESTHPLGAGLVCMAGYVVGVPAVAAGGTASVDGLETRIENYLQDSIFLAATGWAPEGMEHRLIRNLFEESLVARSHPVYFAPVMDGRGTLTPAEDWVELAKEMRIVLVHGPVPKGMATTPDPGEDEGDW